MLKFSRPASGDLAPPGIYKAELRFVDDLGEVTKTFDGKEKTYHQVRFAFMTDPDLQGRVFRISQVFPYSMNQKSNLSAFLRSWLGKQLDVFIEQEASLDELVGRRALLNVVHQERNGTTYANIASVMPCEDDGASGNAPASATPSAPASATLPPLPAMPRPASALPGTWAPPGSDPLEVDLFADN